MPCICRNARRQRVRPADPLQPRWDLGVTQIGMITAVTADDLVRAGAASLAVLRHPDHLPPQARCPAMAGLPSSRQGHDILGVKCTPADHGHDTRAHGDVLQTASRPDISHDMRSLGAQLNPTSVGSATAGVWSSTTLSATISPPDPCGGNCFDLSPAIRTG